MLSSAQRDAFTQRVAPLTGGPSDAYAKLRNCEFVTIEHRELVRGVEQRIAALIDRQDGAPAAPEQVRMLLEGFAWSRLGQAINPADVAQKLKEHGYRERRTLSQGQSRERMRVRTHAYIGRIEQALINGAQIPRALSASIVEQLKTGGESLLLSGGAGVGKSCVLAQVLRLLSDDQIDCMALPASDLHGVLSSSELGQRMGFRDSPVLELARAARSMPAVLCIDQLDALAGRSEANEQAHRVLRELVEQASSNPNLRLLFACRSFDLDEESSLKWIAGGGSAIARTIDVSALTAEDVWRALESAAIERRNLTDSQIELLRVPLHLYLLIEAAHSRELRFATIDDLFDAYWIEKAGKVSARLAAGSSGWMAAVSSLCQALSEREAFAAPDYQLVDSYPAEAVAMASEAVLFMQDGDVGFFHESFFDYAFGRAFASDDRNVTEWLNEDDQGYFRRRQVIAVFNFLRRHDPARYLRRLEELLASSEVRFHLKKRVLDWLRALPDPALEEWEILERLKGPISVHVWDVPRNSVPWFDLLARMQRWERWLSGEDDLVDRAVALLQAPRVQEERISAVLALVVKHQDDSAKWRDRCWSLARWGDGYNTVSKREWLLRLIESEPLEAPEEVALRGKFLSQILFSVEQDAPKFAAEVIAAWFDREFSQLLRAAAENPYSEELRLHLDEWIIGECAAAAPREFVREMFPRLASVEQVAPLKFIGAPQGDDYPQRGLHSLIGDSMVQLAQSDADELRSIAEAVTRKGDLWTHWMCIAWLNAMSTNPETFANEIVQFLLADPRDRLQIGYDYAIGGTELFIAVSRTAVAASSAHCANGVFADLEDAILRFVPHGELSIEHRDMIELALLWCLPGQRIATATGDRIRELEGRFPDEERRGAPQKSDDNAGFKWAVSPIPEADALSTPNEQWLTTMRDVGKSGDTFQGDTFVGGVHELSQTLESATRQDPARFALTNRRDGRHRPAGVLRGHSARFDGERKGLPSGGHAGPNNPRAAQDPRIGSEGAWGGHRRRDRGAGRSASNGRPRAMALPYRYRRSGPRDR